MGALLVAGATLATRLVWLAYSGVRAAPDTGDYWRAAELLRRLDVAGLVETGMIRYLSFDAFVALVQVVFGSWAPEAWVGIQVLAVAAAGGALFRFADEMFGRRAAWLAGGAFAVSYDALQWQAYLLSDSMFLAGLVGVLVVLHAAVRLGGARRWVSAAVLAALVVLARPPGIAVAGAIGAWLLGRRLVPRVRAMPRGKRVASIAALATAGLLVAAGGVVAIDQEPTLGPKIADYYEDGVVVHDDPAFTIDYQPDASEGEGLAAYILANPGAFFFVTAAKVAAFWTVALPRYSMLHVALNLATLLPVVVLGFGGIAVAARESRLRDGAGLAVATVAAITLFHAVTILDWDFRYRAPTIPLLAVFFGFAVDRLWATHVDDPQDTTPGPGRGPGHPDPAIESRPERGGERS
jgi:hypothetical protein